SRFTDLMKIDCATQVPAVHAALAQILEAQPALICTRQPATVLLVMNARLRIEKTFAKQRLYEPLQAAFDGKVQVCTERVQGDIARRESLASKRFAPASEQLLILIVERVFQVLILWTT